MSEKDCEINDSLSSVVGKFVAKQLELLDIERDAEIEENRCLQESHSVKSLSKKGVCISNLRIGNACTGLFGRTLLTFETVSSQSLPSHSVTSGDIVGISNLLGGKIEVITSGVVNRVLDKAVTVAFEKNSNFSDLENDQVYAIVKLANDVTYKRLKRALKALGSKEADSPLVDIIFGIKPPSAFEETTFINLKFFNEGLNKEQQDAVQFALQQREIAILHGPPGTGKTTTLVECIRQAVAQKLKVLACAPSNVAVDNLLEKLSKSGVLKVVRLGHPARSLPTLQKYSLDAIVARYDGSNVIEELHKEIDRLRDKISKTKGSANRRNMWAENKSLIKEAKSREKIIVAHALSHADVILCTLTSGSDDGPLKHIKREMGQSEFDIVAIDECSQSLEAACWVVLPRARKCILAGDHHQLPPTILSNKAAREGLDRTLMERLLQLYGDGIKKMLTTQYRMHELIMQWPSKQLYQSLLVAHSSVRSHVLSELPNVEFTEDTSIPLLLIDTCGLHEELRTEDQASCGNEGEADLVVEHVRRLVEAGVPPSEIAVISPYNLQVDFLKTRLSTPQFSTLEIRSVDGFQGREKEAVVLSLVRSNTQGEVGFLAEDRRINVAITRARRHLAVVCDSRTVSRHEFLKDFVKYCEEFGEVRSSGIYDREIHKWPSVLKNETKKELITSEKNVKKKEKKTGTDNTKKNKNNSSSPQTKIEKDVKSRTLLEKESTENQYEKILEDFVKSSDQFLQFLPSLNSFERLIVHEIAEKMGLIHISTGEGIERRIEVRKTSYKSSKAHNSEKVSENFQASTVPMNSVTEPKGSNSETIRLDNKTSHQTKNSSECELNSSRTDLHKTSQNIQHSTVLDNIPTPSSSCESEKISKSSNSEKSSKSKKKDKPKLKSIELKEEEDFDALLAEAVKVDKTCRFTGCKKSVSVLFQDCLHCGGRFCCSHFIPEAHGCGVAAKAMARAQIRKDHVLYAGSGRPEKKMDHIKHNYLHGKLDKKLNEMANKRKVKTKKPEE